MSHWGGVILRLGSIGEAVEYSLSLLFKNLSGDFAYYNFEGLRYEQQISNTGLVPDAVASRQALQSIGFVLLIKLTFSTRSRQLDFVNREIRKYKSGKKNKINRSERNFWNFCFEGNNLPARHWARIPRFVGQCAGGKKCTVKSRAGQTKKFNCLRNVLIKNLGHWSKGVRSV